MALTDNIVAYWKLDGNSNDAVGSNNGTDSNITYSSANGIINEGAGFNGSSSKIILGSTPLTGTGAFTYNIWFKTSSSARGAIMSMGSEANANRGVIAQIVDGGDGYKLYFQLPANGGTKSDNTVNDGIWHMATFIGTGANQCKLYIDAIQNGSTFAATYDLEADRRDLGREYNGGSERYWFNGALDEFCPWSRALSETEITELYNSGAALQYPFSSGGSLRNFYFNLLGVGQ